MSDAKVICSACGRVNLKGEHCPTCWGLEPKPLPVVCIAREYIPKGGIFYLRLGPKGWEHVQDDGTPFADAPTVVEGA